MTSETEVFFIELAGVLVGIIVIIISIRVGKKKK